MNLKEALKKLPGTEYFRKNVMKLKFSGSFTFQGKCSRIQSFYVKATEKETNN